MNSEEGRREKGRRKEEIDFSKRALHRLGPALFIAASILWYVAGLIYLMIMWGSGV